MAKVFSFLVGLVMVAIEKRCVFANENLEKVIEEFFASERPDDAEAQDCYPELDVDLVAQEPPPSLRGAAVPNSCDNVVPLEEIWEAAEAAIYETTPPAPTQRLILIYSQQEPTRGTSGGIERYLKKTNGRLSLDLIRASVMVELAERISQYLSVRQSRICSSNKKIQGVEALPFTSEDLPMTPRVRTLNSRYLKSLGMEIILDFPPPLTNGEVKRIAEKMCCVEKVFFDEKKTLGTAERATLKIPKSGPNKSIRLLGNSKFSIANRLNRLQLTRQSKTPGADRGRIRGISDTVRASTQISGVPQGLKEHYSTSLPMPHLHGSHVGVHPLPFAAQASPAAPLEAWNLLDRYPGSVSAEIGWQISKHVTSEFPIAIIDSGCDVTHPDLAPKLWVNQGEICGDGIDNDGNGFVDDCHGWNFVNNNNDLQPRQDGHGTAAAGIVGSADSRQFGRIGVCPMCQIMCLKFIEHARGAVSDQVQAIDYAISMGARVSNNSYGGYGHSSLEYEAIKRASLANHIFVASAGNHSLDTDLTQNYHTPSGYNLPNVVSVGASNSQSLMAPFSNFGKQSVHLMAPGTGILTLRPGGNYAIAMGTSFAAPHVAGLLGVAWSTFPNVKYQRLCKALFQGSNKSEALMTAARCRGVANLRGLLIAAYKINQNDSQC